MKDSLYYDDEPIEILEHPVIKLRDKEASFIMVLWRIQSVEELLGKKKKP